MQLTPRHNAILELARKQGQVLVDDLAAAFEVTPQTVRKDLNDLCRAPDAAPHPWWGALSIRRREHGI